MQCNKKGESKTELGAEKGAGKKVSRKGPESSSLSKWNREEGNQKGQVGCDFKKG